MRTVREEIKDAIGVYFFIILIFFVFFLIAAFVLEMTMDQAENRRRNADRRSKEAETERKRQDDEKKKQQEAASQAEAEWQARLADAKRTTKPVFDEVLPPDAWSRCIQKATGIGAVWETEKGASFKYYTAADGETVRKALTTWKIDDFSQLWFHNDSNEPNRIRMWFAPHVTTNTQNDLLGNSARMEMKRAPDIVQTLGPRDMTEAIKLTGRGKTQYILDVDGLTRIFCISGTNNQTTLARCCGYPCDMSNFNTCHHIRVLNDEEEKNVTLRLWFYNVYGEGRREGLPGIDY